MSFSAEGCLQVTRSPSGVLKVGRFSYHGKQDLYVQANTTETKQQCSRNGASSSGTASNYMMHMPLPAPLPVFRMALAEADSPSRLMR